jgi:hypothetical protein
MTNTSSAVQTPASFEDLKLLIHSELYQIEQGKHVDT